jgi:hypothetical protein
MTPLPPDPSLDDLQAWFGRAISRPLPKAYRDNPLAESAPELEAEGDALIHGGGGVSGFGRVGIYNQQYWFRLVTILQEEYPCAIHVLGLAAYNDWAVRFLDSHPPDSPFLSRLDAQWPAYMAREYDGADREAVLQALAFDRAFSRAFDAPDGHPLPGEGASLPPPVPDAAALRLRLSPHATTLRLTFDFPAFRPLCLADASLEEAIPLAPGGSPLIVWRGRDLALRHRPLPEAACKVLESLREPATLPEAFARLEGALAPEEERELVANLTDWFAEWTREGILSLG